MSRPIIISLCDLTGNFVRPWAEAGFECWCVDVQHSIRRERIEGNIHFVWGDVRSWTPPRGRKITLVAGFSPCTHLAVSGARDFKTKGMPLLCDGLTLFNSVIHAAEWSGAPYCAENPVGVLSSHFKKPDHIFHPWEYAGYLADIQTDNTQKKTCLWVGGGFVMPPKMPAPDPHRTDCHDASPSEDRADIRSATPMGFARAVFEANRPPSESIILAA